MPWPILAGIGEVESDHGRSNLPGVHSGSNAFGAAGPMQIGIGGAAGNVWGGAPVHPASEQVNGVATDGNGDGIASVYEPADAIAGAAKYLLRNGVQSNVRGAIFAYNHLVSYVQDVLSWASTYARGGFIVGPVTVAQQCSTLVSSQVPNHVVSVAIAYAEAQIGKPYLWGGTGPDAFDCSGLVMMAYRQAGVDIPRTSEEQWAWGPRIQPGHEEPGDLVFFAGSDGTQTNPGHVGLVIGKGKIVEAYATGTRIASPRSARATRRRAISPWSASAAPGRTQASCSAAGARLVTGARRRALTRSVSAAITRLMLRANRWARQSSAEGPLTAFCGPHHHVTTTGRHSEGSTHGRCCPTPCAPASGPPGRPAPGDPGRPAGATPRCITPCRRGRPARARPRRHRPRRPARLRRGAG